MAFKTATYTIPWHDDSREFFHRVVASVTRQFPGVKAHALYQPVHGPAMSFHTSYAMSHSRARTGDLVKVTVSFHYDPTAFASMVTSFRLAEWKPAPPPPAPVPAAPPPPPVEWQLTVYDKIISGPFPGLRVKLRLPGGIEQWFTTDTKGVIKIKEPDITAGRVDIIDVLDDSATPNIKYSSFTRMGLATGGKHTLDVPNERKAVDLVISVAGVNRRSTFGKKTPPHWKMDQDWDYDTITIHHSGNSGEDDPAAIESQHMGPKGYDDIGYHFMINLKGKIYEGRHLAFKGSHVLGANTGKIGVLMMGDFEHQWWDSDDDPTNAQITSLGSLIGALKAVLPSLKKVGGHRDYKAGTDCPGGEMYKLIPAIRTGTGLGGP
jgi:hypothetical protein